MITLKEAGNEDRELLWNINQKYLYEMTQYYSNEMDEKENIRYGYFDRYFSDPERTALFIMSDGILSGFAFIHPYSLIDGNPNHTMAEFTVFPSCRRQHIGSDAMKLIFDRYPGRWEIKYHEKNIPAALFWNRMTEKYHPERVSFSDEETVLVFEVKGTGVTVTAFYPGLTATGFEKAAAMEKGSALFRFASKAEDVARGGSGL